MLLIAFGYELYNYCIRFFSVEDSRKFERNQIFIETFNDKTYFDGNSIEDLLNIAVEGILG